MRGFADQATFEVAPVAGETLVIAGVRCTFHVTAKGRAYLSDPVSPKVSAIPTADGRWYVSVGELGIYVTNPADVRAVST